MAMNCVSATIAGMSNGQIDVRRRLTTSQAPAIALTQVAT